MTYAEQVIENTNRVTEVIPPGHYTERRAAVYAGVIRALMMMVHKDFGQEAFERYADALELTIAVNKTAGTLD